jgi:hypothetical protein
VVQEYTGMRQEPYAVRRGNTIMLHMDGDDRAAKQHGHSQALEFTVVRCPQG